MNLKTKKTEAGLLMQQIQKDDFVVLLDERGKQFTSPLLANFIQQRANESCKRMLFIIGGAFGVDDLIIKREILDKSDLSSSSYTIKILKFL